MTSVSEVRPASRSPRSTGWLDAAALVIAMGALGVAYAVGAHLVAFILCAMVASALATLAFTGLGGEVERDRPMMKGGRLCE